jgi:hypothetical protein
MKRRGKIIAGILLAAIIVFIGFVFLSARGPGLPTQNQVTLASPGFANETYGVNVLRTQGQFCVFTLSNSSSETILYSPESMAVWTTNGWQWTPFTGPQRNMLVGQWPGLKGTIGPRTSQTFFVPLPGTNQWKLRFGFYEHAKGWNGWKEKFFVRWHNFRNEMNGSTARLDQFSGGKFQIETPEIVPPTSTNVF